MIGCAIVVLKCHWCRQLRYFQPQTKGNPRNKASTYGLACSYNGRLSVGGRSELKLRTNGEHAAKRIFLVKRGSYRSFSTTRSVQSNSCRCW